MTAVVVALSLLGLGNLVITVTVVRRLNEHTGVLDRLAGEPPLVTRPVGATVDEFAAVATDGTAVASGRLAPPTLVGFFSPGCGPCHERLPEFVARARRVPAGRALAVVAGAGNAAAELVTELAGAATVVLEPPDGPVARAFGVRGFPAFALLGDGGRIEATGTELTALPVLVAV
jgi:hypothetical protein